MTERFDAIVIGAGIVGVSTALHLQMRDKKVLLIDRRGPGEETSYGNLGMMEMAHVLPFGFPPMSRWLSIALNQDTMARLDYASLPRTLPWIFKLFLNLQPEGMLKTGRAIWPLVSRAIDEHQALMTGTDAATYWKSQGRVSIYRTEDGFQRDAFLRATAQKAGVPFKIYSAGQFRDIEPDLKPAYVKAVQWLSTACTTNPSALVKCYAKRFTDQGGVFMQTPISRADNFAGKWRVGTPSGTIETPNMVLCMGPWTTDITKRLGYKFPMGYKRGYHYHYPAVGGAVMKHTLSDAEYGYGIAPMEQGYRITTGAEFADRDAEHHPGQLDQILPLARELFPLGEPIEAKPWMGSRPCFPDSLPVIGPAGRHEGLWFNFGHGHVGLTIGPSSARLLAEMITRQLPFCDPAPYSANRFN